MKLTFFSDPNLLHHVDRGLLTRLLEDFKHCLPPEAAAPLATRPDYDQWCSSWAAQFSSPAAFGAPLLEALVAIETLSLPEHAALLEEALNRVADNWRPLFQIAHVIGGHWPARVTEAFHALRSVPQPSLENSALRNPKSALGMSSSSSFSSSSSSLVAPKSDGGGLVGPKSDEGGPPHSALEDSAIRNPQSKNPQLSTINFSATSATSSPTLPPLASPPPSSSPSSAPFPIAPGLPSSVANPSPNAGSPAVSAPSASAPVTSASTASRPKATASPTSPPCLPSSWPSHSSAPSQTPSPERTNYDAGASEERPSIAPSLHYSTTPLLHHSTTPPLHSSGNPCHKSKTATIYRAGWSPPDPAVSSRAPAAVVQPPLSEEVEG